jgi:hypothetical protein
MSSLLNLALGVAMQVGTPGPSEMPAAPAPANAFSYTGSEGSSEQRHPFDTQRNWVHGYFQEIPAYGGHHLFRPYNYKDVLSQSQTAAGWGERPTMPYSQQFWHKYHDQATMIKSTQNAPIRGQQVVMPTANRQMPGYPGWTVAPGTQIVVPQQPQMAPPSSGSFHMPPNFTPVGYPEGQQNPGVQNAVEYVNPAAYRR